MLRVRAGNCSCCCSRTCSSAQVAAYDPRAEVIRFTNDENIADMARQVRPNPYAHLDEWLHRRLRGDALAAALFRNVATWCQGLAEGWQVDLYSVLTLSAWIDNRDGTVYAYEAGEASIIVLTANACVGGSSYIPQDTYRTLGGAGNYIRSPGLRTVGQLDPWVERLRGLGFSISTEPLSSWPQPLHDNRLQMASGALLRAAWGA